MQSTFQTRPPELSAATLKSFDRWAELHGRIERQLFAAYCASGYDAKAIDAAKSRICAKEHITARQFNAIWRLLKGKIASKAAVDQLALADIRTNLKAVRASLARLKKQKAPLSPVQRRQWANKKRRLARLERRERELANNHVPICFGSRKLFRAQFALDENGYRDHTEWLADWQTARNNTFYLLGSKGESGGNQTCTATVAEDGSLRLRVRVPDALIESGGPKYVTLNGVRFAYGQEELVAALAAGRSISYRFKRDDKGWRIFATTERVDTRKAFSALAGVIGVDINADHMAVAETDRFGNLVAQFSVPCVTHGKSVDQRLEAIRLAAKTIVGHAARVGKPIVHEELDFSERKRALRESDGPRYARMLSSFAYGSLIQAIESRALRQEVPTHAVNPAYTSVIGRIKYAKRLGVSTHQAAALVIGRRGLEFCERAPRSSNIPDGKGEHLIFELPARNRSMHEWAHWARVRKKLQETLAGYHRLRALAALEAAAAAAADASRGPTDVGAVRSGPSNRQHNRSAGVLSESRAALAA